MTYQELRNIIYEKLKISEKDENIERLTREQMIFITHDINTPCYLEACPGSGKTEVVGIKAAFELIDWKPKFSGVTFLSFTNNASEEISQRVKKFAGYKAGNHPHFIGTIDKWIYNYIFLPFVPNAIGFKGIDGDKSPREIFDDKSKADFLNEYKVAKLRYVTKVNNTILKGDTILPHQYFYDSIGNKFFIKADGMGEFKELNYYLSKPELAEYCNLYSINLDEQIAIDELVKAKKKFWKDGWFSFSDIEFLSCTCLSKKQSIAKLISKRFSHIIIDECQDLSASQLLLFEHLTKEGCFVHFVGDLNQAIWSFRHVNPEYFRDFVTKSKVSKLKLSENFRCNQNIVNICQIIIPDNIRGQAVICNPSCIYIEYNNDTELQKLPEIFDEILESVNSKNINLIDKSKTAIVGRAWKDLSSINTSNYNSKNMYENLAMAFICWNKSQKSSDDIKNAILNTGLFFSKAFYNNRGKKMDYYCIETIDSISWRKYLSNFLTLYSQEYNPIFNRKNKPHNWSSWASNVRELIKKVFEELPQKSLAALEDIVKKTITQGKSKELVKDTFIIENGNNPFRLTTIHDVKGETLDAILFLSSKTKHSGGGHFEQWFEQSPRTDVEKEYKRFGYVACSRPKHLLVLAVPKLKIERKIKLEGLGFTPFTKQIKALF